MTSVIWKSTCTKSVCIAYLKLPTSNKDITENQTNNDSQQW